MPGIFEVSCDRCDYRIEAIMSITLVIKDDGTEVICPHPLEYRTAEAETGRAWRDLLREGRIAWRHGFVCLGCGEFGYYGPDQLRKPARGMGHIGNITHQPTPREASEYACRACGGRDMHPLCGDTGCLTTLLELLGRKRPRVACPKCRDGQLTSELVAIS